MNSGDTFAQYEITSLLGKGGMGEVYRARDTKLGRDVAIKVLPAQMTRDPERVARFRREARTLAALNHANIASLFGFEDIDDHLFLVMELVEGESLEQMLAGGPLTLQESLNIARQIADGLEEAHENGIVHRDLKPANIMLTTDGRVKILDFGLARAYQGEGVSESNADMSPTITAAMTQAGTILGTAAYMSPEQARGKGVDRRSDLWAFGVLLWEMLSGKRLFLGETISDTLAAILRADPDWDQLPDDTPEEVKRLIARCLERDQRRRLRDIGEARVRLERWDRDPTTMHSPVTGEMQLATESTSERWLPWAVTVLAVLAAVYFGFQIPRAENASTTPSALNVDLHLPNLMAPVSNKGPLVILGPQGDRVVYMAKDDLIYAKDLGKREVWQLEDTSGAHSLAFSPDGQWIAFDTTFQIMRVAFTGGSPITVLDTDNTRGLAWVDNTSLVFSPTYHSGLSVVSLTDNSVRELTQLDIEANERSHRWPQVLPDGEHVLFQAQRLGRSYDRSDLVVVNLQTAERKTVYRGGSFPRYARSGHLVFARERTLFAIRFDLATLTTSGLAVPVLEDVRTFVVDQQKDDGSAHYDISANGSLVYAPAGNQGMVNLALLDLATGKATIFEEPGNYSMPVLSPDGRTLAIVITRRGKTSVQLINTESGLASPHGLIETTEYLGAWSPDSQYLYWSYADADGNYTIARQRADRADDIAVLLVSKYFVAPSSVSPDGQRLLFSTFRDNNFWDVQELDLATNEVHDFLDSADNEIAGAYSPDGKWVAYAQVTPRAERILRIADASNPQRSIPVVNNIDVGFNYCWSPDTDAIVIRNRETFRSYPLQMEGSQLRVGPPKTLQHDSYIPGGDFPTSDIQSDLSRAIVMVPVGGEGMGLPEGYDVLVTDWFTELEKMVPTQAK